MGLAMLGVLSPAMLRVMAPHLRKALPEAPQAKQQKAGLYQLLHVAAYNSARA